MPWRLYVSMKRFQRGWGRRADDPIVHASERAVGLFLTSAVSAMMGDGSCSVPWSGFARGFNTVHAAFECHEDERARFHFLGLPPILASPHRNSSARAVCKRRTDSIRCRPPREWPFSSISGVSWESGDHLLPIRLGRVVARKGIPRKGGADVEFTLDAGCPKA